jgi:VWFA-related protein
MITRVLALAIAGLSLILAGCANDNLATESPTPSGIGPTSAALEIGQCPQATPRLVAQPGYRELVLSLDVGKDNKPAKLNPTDLKIYDGDKELPIKIFEQQGVSLGILVDTSGSMAKKLDSTKAVLIELLDVLSPGDEIFLVAFSSRPFVIQAFTFHRELITNRLNLLYAFGQTDLNSTIVQGLLMVRHGCNQNKALFVVTDGIDDNSSVTRTKMLDTVKRFQVPIFALGIGDKAKPSSSGSTMFALSGDLDMVDAQSLRGIAEASGGRSYILPELGGTEAKATAIAIADGIDNHYVVGFVTGGAAKSKIRIELLNHPGSTLRIEGAPADVTVANSQS